MTARRSRGGVAGLLLRGAAYLAAPVVVSATLVAACATERPEATAGGTTTPPSGSDCSTPNEGCECYEPGKSVECGIVEHSAGGYVACAMGRRQCVGTTWGSCIGEGDVAIRRALVASGGLATLALGTGARCGADGGGPANPCDPYCQAFVDDGIGLDAGTGFTTSDGGLVVAPDPDGGLDGGVPGGYAAPPGGLSQCVPATQNLVAATCTYGTAAALSACQQDFHCDALTNTCLWNGGPGYADPTAAGIDLTLVAPCGPTGGPTASATVCNRGTATAAAGSPVHFWATSGPTPPDACTALGTPTYVYTLADALVPGACASFTVPSAPGAKYLTLNAGAPGAQPINEGPGRCANNSAYFRTDGAPGCATCAACNTAITGRVYDPSGTPTSTPAIANSNSIPLAGVTVFQPAAPLTALTDGVQCDTCASLSTPAQTQVTTLADGSFTLNNVSPGAAVPIVVQTGRWRRAITMNVPACVTTAVPNGVLRLPRHRTDGLGGVAAIPKIAMVTGNKDSLECFLGKLGITSAPGTGEMQRRVGPGDANRIQIWRDNGMNTSPGAPSLTGLMNSQAFINEYSAILVDCLDDTGSVGYAATTAQAARFGNYANAGGRIFMDHWPGDPFIKNNTLTPGWSGAGVATWVTPSSPSTMKGVVNVGTPPQVLLRDWLSNVGASTDYGFGTIRVDTPRRHVGAVNPANSIEWIRGSSTSPTTWTGAGNMTLSMSFETPLGAGANCGTPGGRGRVLYNGMHIAATRTSNATGTFPNNCNFAQALTPEEKALEYQFFQLTACELGGAPPPPPPPVPPPLPAITYTRDYRGLCGTGEMPKWGPFYWQGDIPAGTQIVFRAATSDAIATLPAAPPAGAPVTASVGAAGATVLAPSWDCAGCPGGPIPVDSQLVTDTASKSKEYLRIYMQFQPNGAISPTLYSWRQIYDCVPAE